MPGAPRTTPIPVQQAIVDECGIPTEAFIRYLEELVGNATSTSGKVPLGTIVMYTGTVADIPDGWALCNGENDTPDLNAKFIVGTTTEEEIGNTGGSAIPAVLSHTHTIDHVHASFHTANDGDHDHSYDNYPVVDYYSVPDDVTGWSHNNPDPQGHSTGGDASHDHEVDVPAYSGTSGDRESGDQTEGNLPPYYTVAYIINVGTPNRRRR